jgi:subtilase family serine protease
MTYSVRGHRGARLASTFLLSAVLALVALPVSSAGAVAPVVPLVNTMNRLHLSRAAQSAAGRTVKQQTGLAPSQVAVGDACGTAISGHASCMAQVLVSRATHARLRAHVSRQRSFTQVFPRYRAHAAIVPADDAAPAAVPSGGTPAYLQNVYDLTYLSQTAGVGDTVAIVDAYDDATAESDLATYRANFGLPACTTANGCFKKVNQNGQSSPLPATNSGWNTEESLDLDAVSALCPNCKILLVEGNDNGLGSLQTAIQTAGTLGAKQISNSWSFGASGAVSSSGYTFPGASVIASSGDNGYMSGFAAYPASLPGVTAAGGTGIIGASPTSTHPRGLYETAWGGAGSGCNVWEAKPAFESDTGCTGRTYTDVSADAWPGSGLTIYNHGSWGVVGGTSLSSPLIAAFEALTGVDGTTPAWAYSDSSLLHDIGMGSNGSCANFYVCNGVLGYDGPTGAGSISGAIAQGAPGVALGSGGSGGYAAGIGYYGLNLLAGVYPNGLDTTYYFEYGTTNAYGQQTTPVDIGTGPAMVTINSSIHGLQPATAYHYRLVAQNSAGTAYGYDYTFTTNAIANAPVNTAHPTVSGTTNATAYPGQTLTADPGTWNPTGTIAYQWMSSSDGGTTWNPISGATASSYTLTGSDTGNKIRITVTETNSYGSASGSSLGTQPILSAAPVNTAHPTVSGTVNQIAYQGATLTGAVGTWSPSGSFSYQWMDSSDGGTTWTAIPGATNLTYVVAASDVGKRIRITVTATNSYGSASGSSLGAAVSQ